MIKVVKMDIMKCKDAQLLTMTYKLEIEQTRSAQLEMELLKNRYQELQRKVEQSVTRINEIGKNLRELLGARDEFRPEWITEFKEDAVILDEPVLPNNQKVKRTESKESSNGKVEKANVECDRRR